MNNKYEVVVYWSEPDGRFLAEVPELPSIITDGTSRVEALQNAEEMIDAYLKTAREASWPIPEPKGRLAFAESFGEARFHTFGNLEAIGGRALCQCVLCS